MKRVIESAIYLYMPGTLEDYATAVSEVISVCRDAEQGFRGAANAARASLLSDTFVGYSLQFGNYATEIQESLKSMGFDPTYPLGVAGMLHAGWVNLKAFVDGHDEHGIWVEVGHMINRALKTYQAALEKNLPVGIRAVLQKQYQDIEKMNIHVTGRTEATIPENNLS